MGTFGALLTQHPCCQADTQSHWRKRPLRQAIPWLNFLLCALPLLADASQTHRAKNRPLPPRAPTAALCAQAVLDTQKKNLLHGEEPITTQRLAQWAHANPSCTATLKRASTQELHTLQQQLQNLQRQTVLTKQSREKASEELRIVDQAIGNAEHRLTTLSQMQNQTQRQLYYALSEERRLEHLMKRQRHVMAQYLQDHFKQQFLLSSSWTSGTSDSVSIRELRYLRYLSVAHQDEVQRLKQRLSSLNNARLEAETTAQRLHQLEAERRQQKNLLLLKKTEHIQQVATLGRQWMTQHRQLEQLQDNENRLSHLVRHLAKLNVALSPKIPSSARQPRTKQPLASSNLNKRGESAAQLRIEQLPLLKPLLSLKGQLQAPIATSPINRFGETRSENGVTWRGWFYPAKDGAAIHSVASGRVVYNDWLRGFGKMVIVDHGKGLMSIYSSVEEVTEPVGSQVNAGQRIAQAGNNSGYTNSSGLYFELRYQGKPFDPAGWVGSARPSPTG